MPRLRVTRASATGAAVVEAAAGPSYDADATTYITAVEAADGQSLESGVKSAINDFVVGCKTDGNWSALKASCILAGARTLAGALVPLVGTAPTNFNFVSADYNRKTGLVGNGSTKKLFTGLNYNQTQRNSTHFAVYADTINRQSNKVLVGAFTEGGIGLQGGSMFVYHVHNQSYIQGYDVDNTISSPNTAGFIGVTRPNSAEIVRRRLNQSLTITAASAAPANQGVNIYGYWGTDAYYYAGRLSYYSVGDNVDLALLDTRITTLMSALATAIP